jgi:hypothetical protein
VAISFPKSRLLLPLLFCLIGCSQAETIVEVSGTVRHGENPVKTGSVQFNSSKNGGVTDLEITDGKYSGPLAVGEYSVAITPKIQIKDNGGLPEVIMLPAADIPEKYRVTSTSGFKATVEKESKTFDFKMPR